MLPEGFNREPLYRAEVYVYVFNTTYPEVTPNPLKAFIRDQLLY